MLQNSDVVNVRVRCRHVLDGRGVAAAYEQSWSIDESVSAKVMAISEIESVGSEYESCTEWYNRYNNHVIATARLLSHYTTLVMGFH